MAGVISQLKQAPADGWKFVQDRLAKIDFFDETKADLQKESPWYQLGGIYYLYWMVVIISGVILVAIYLPTTSQAFDSIISFSENKLGMILRGLHKYAGDGMIIAATLRVYRMYFNAEYKNKGEFTFVLSIILLLAAMYSGLTGYLLIWNQRAFWATKIFATFPMYLDITPKYWYWPWEGIVVENTWFLPNAIGAVTKMIGDYTHQGMTTSQILLGGSSIGQATMTRFYSLHFTISLILLVVTELYFYKNRFKRLNLRMPAILIMLGMVLITAIMIPAETGSRANPEVTPLPILSDWYFLALYQMLRYMDPYWATIWTVGIPVITIGLAFLDWGEERNMWKRPIFTMVGIAAAVEFLVFSAMIVMNKSNIETDPPFWFGHMILFMGIGQFWHWGQYQQQLPLRAWVYGCALFGVWYLFFWHVFAADWLMVWFNSFSGGALPEGWNPANLYWSMLWAAFSIGQVVLAEILIMVDSRRKTRQEMAEAGA
ncbi:MAG: cytochrome b N-terminal domain-containing protein [Vampirovibrio sp.]|nr:cytochrome b N-terminal domain-containing protein [Vampirovibrio sp.]